MGKPRATKAEREATQTAICEGMIEGNSLRTILAADGMPSMSTVFRWLADDDRFREQYARAREIQADILFEEIRDIADDGTNDWMARKLGDEETEVLNHEHIQRSRLRVDARKWMASKLAPKKYGDDLKLRHADADGERLPIEAPARAVRLASILAAIDPRLAGRREES